MGTNFPGSHNSMDFAAFSYAMGNWWGNSCISHIIKYTIGWGSNGKMHPFYGKNVGTNFPDPAHPMGFAHFSNTMRNLMRKPMHFPCDEI